ncbi:MAG: SH3 domain-containing protein [Anaerolineae bacterium]|nr:SH3 domain-containing protein [Anaerolineae bacterium]
MLNVRANPSINAARIAQVFLYRSYPILGISADGGWFLIELRDGRTGWVSARYIYRVDHSPVPVVQAASSNQSALPNIEVAGVATAELKIRVFPRTGEQIGLVPNGALVRVLARNSNGSWFYISWQGVEGWVFSPYIRLTNGRVIDLIVR